MKKIYLVSLIFLFLFSCSNSNKKSREKIKMKDSETLLEIVIIDNCEYLYGAWGNATVLTHKGNCKNLIHKYNE
jgi:hypothetical protein